MNDDVIGVACIILFVAFYIWLFYYAYKKMKKEEEDGTKRL